MEYKCEGLNSLAKRIAKWREIKGFKTDWDCMMQKLVLVVEEVSEANRAYRHQDREKFDEEIADVFIRLLDIVGSLKIDIEEEIDKKMRVNEKRPRRHGTKIPY